MNNVVRFNTTKRKLDWKAEEELRDGKKRDQQRRENRIQGREAKTVGEDDE